jgi:class 3 adenylate cyclase
MNFENPDVLLDFWTRLARAADSIESPHVVRIKALGDTLMYASGVAALIEDRSSNNSSHKKTTQLEEDPEYHHLLALVRVMVKVYAAVTYVAAGGKTISGVAGLHSGPVACGVLGDDRLTFDLFGDTANTAARVKANAPREGVWATASFAARTREIQDGFEQMERKLVWDDANPVPVHMKGKGITPIVQLKRF